MMAPPRNHMKTRRTGGYQLTITATTTTHTNAASPNKGHIASESPSFAPLLSPISNGSVARVATAPHARRAVVGAAKRERDQAACRPTHAQQAQQELARTARAPDLCPQVASLGSLPASGIWDLCPQVGWLKRAPLPPPSGPRSSTPSVRPSGAKGRSPRRTLSASAKSGKKRKKEREGAPSRRASP